MLVSTPSALFSWRKLLASSAKCSQRDLRVLKFRSSKLDVCLNASSPGQKTLKFTTNFLLHLSTCRLPRVWGYTRGKLLDTCKWPRVRSVIDPIVMKCTTCHVSTKYTRLKRQPRVYNPRGQLLAICHMVIFFFPKVSQKY